MTDPIVQEVRKHRMEHTRKFGGNLAAICADLRKIQADSGHVVVSLTPEKPKPLTIRKTQKDISTEGNG